MKKVLLLSLLLVLAAGCASVPLQIPNVANTGDYDELGVGSGKSVGIMLFGVIPINQNQRFEKAYRAALASRGGDQLKDPVITERWFWAGVLNGYMTKVEGMVIRKK